jgi:hypothetical protein
LAEQQPSEGEEAVDGALAERAQCLEREKREFGKRERREKRT